MTIICGDCEDKNAVGSIWDVPDRAIIYLCRACALIRRTKKPPVEMPSSDPALSFFCGEWEKQAHEAGDCDCHSPA